MSEKQIKAEDGQRTSASRDLRALAAAAGATVIGIALVAVLQKGVGIADSATTVALLLVPLLVYGIVSGRLRELTGPGGWGAKFAEFETELEKTKAEVRAIQFALEGILTKHEIGHLKGLTTDQDYLIQWEPDLYRYLHRLDGLNFIQPHPGLGLMTIEDRYRTDDPPEGRPRFNLKDFVYITDDGRTYLNVLSQILEKSRK